MNGLSGASPGDYVTCVRRKPRIAWDYFIFPFKMFVYGYTMWVRPEEGILAPRTRVTEGYQIHVGAGCWEPNMEVLWKGSLCP